MFNLWDLLVFFALETLPVVANVFGIAWSLFRKVPVTWLYFVESSSPSKIQHSTYFQQKTWFYCKKKSNNFLRILRPILIKWNDFHLESFRLLTRSSQAFYWSNSFAWPFPTLHLLKRFIFSYAASIKLQTHIFQ